MSFKEMRFFINFIPFISVYSPLGLVMNRQYFKRKWQADEEDDGDDGDSREITRDINMMALTLRSIPPSLHLSLSLLCCFHVVISRVFMFFNPFKFKFPAFLMLSLSLSSLFPLSHYFLLLCRPSPVKYALLLLFYWVLLFSVPFIQYALLEA